MSTPALCHPNPAPNAETASAHSTHSTLSTPAQRVEQPAPSKTTTEPIFETATTNSTNSTPAHNPVERQAINSGAAAFLHQLPELAHLDLPTDMPVPTPRDRTEEQKAKVLVATAAGANLHAAARAAGVHRTTIYVWQKEDPEFAAGLRNAREARLQENLESIQGLQHQALATLSQVLNDPNASPALRLRAAIFILTTNTAAAPKPSRHADLEFSRVLLDQMFANPFRTAIESSTSQQTRSAIQPTGAATRAAHQAAAQKSPANQTAATAYAPATAIARRDHVDTPGGSAENDSPAIRTTAHTPPQPTVARLNTPRNAPCPCKSGLKFKRCCGKSATPVLGTQAAAA